MLRSLALALVVLLAAGLALLVATSGEPAEPAAPRASQERAGGGDPGAADLAAVERSGPRRAAKAAESAKREVAAEAGPVGAAPAPAPEEEAADLDATQGLDVRVVDAGGAPVMDARVRIMGHRTEAQPGTYFSYRGDAPEDRTDFDGRARLEHFSWVDQDGRVSQVDLHVEHDDYIQFRDSLFPVDPDTLHEVRLERGGTVALTPWIGDPSRVVADVRVRTDWDASVSRGDWEVEPGGRRTTDRFSPGPHRIRVTHVTEEGESYFSDLVDFTIESGGYEELFVELRPAVDFVGEVDPRVPRPIVDGIAILSVHSLGPRGRPSLGDERRAQVDAGGRFTFPGVPAGEGQVVVLCEGWVSARAALPVEPPSDGWPSVEVPGEGAFTVPMEPTGGIEATVLGPGGRPLAGATVRVSPNYSFWGLGSSIIPGREWRSTTGPDGIAVIDDIPPVDSLFVSVTHEDHQLREAERLETPTVPIRSRERTQRTFELEAKPSR